MAKTPKTPPPAADPWDRRPGESAMWYARFHDHYLLFPDPSRRSLEAAWRSWFQKTAKGVIDRARRPPQGWSQASRRWDWGSRAAAWDDKQRTQHRESAAEQIRKLQEKHILQLRYLSNQVIKAAQTVDWDALTPEQVFRMTDRVIYLERLVHGQPVSVEQVQHAGPDGGPVRSVNGHVVTGGPEADPAYLAEVLKILAAHNGLAAVDEPSEPAGDSLDGDTKLG